MRRNAKIDSNQIEMRLAFRKLGARVLSLAAIGKGCPDLLICYRGILYLIEVKTEKGKLNDLQKKWHSDWGGPVKTLYSTDEAIAWVSELTTS